MNEVQFDDFFAEYADTVEGINEAAYWQLSDALIKELFRRHLGPVAGEHIIDIGGGTARWALWLAEELDVEVTVADKSARMLAVARENIAGSPYAERIHLQLCDVQDADALSHQQFAGAVSTYGVLSFLSNPSRAFTSISRSLKPGASALLMSHSYSNALHTKLSRDAASPAEIAELLGSRMVKWAPHVPTLRVYSAADLQLLSEQAGLEYQRVYGVTTLVYPGAEDFGYPYASQSLVSERLRDPDWFAAALQAEIAASEDPAWAERGVNLMLHARKPM
jgi:ubiquinone/menaquinone biosynthesis C-methylase UbiE